MIVQKRILIDPNTDDGHLLDGRYYVTEPTTAVWKNISNGVGVCSNCHRQDNVDPLAKYCRYCGSKMLLWKEKEI